MFMNGELVKTGETLSLTNSATSETAYEIQKSGKFEINQAFEALGSKNDC